MSLDRKPDVEADITLFSTEQGGRKSGALSGYRPAHKVHDDYLTTGVHKYLDCEVLMPGSTARGTITFITPEVYPHCLWLGCEIDIQEGGHLVGRAHITKILNPLLDKMAN